MSKKKQLFIVVNEDWRHSDDAEIRAVTIPYGTPTDWTEQEVATKLGIEDLNALIGIFDSKKEAKKAL